ncbi:MAG: sugar nucleotide-binding protein, partial [Methylocystis sp.]|nr:sugar nucleotide-binding protein [Methylocystis sp.]
ARSKAKGEAAVRELVSRAVILRPCVIFGPEDDFFNRFAAMARLLPLLPLVGAKTRFQPVFVGDVAQATALALAGKAAAGATYELGGPQVKSLRELVEYVLAVTQRHRRLVAIPFGSAKLVAGATQLLRKLSLGLFPKSLSLTGDQVELLRCDNVVSEQAKSAGLTLEGLGIAPQAIGAIAPAYLYRFRKSGQYQAQRIA